MKTFAKILGVVVLVVSLSGCASTDEGTKSVNLFNGKNLDGLDYHLVKPKLKMSDVWSVKDGILICKGNPMGYIGTNKDYTNYKLVVEWRWAPGKKAGNSGILLRVTGPKQGLPKCCEVQLQHGKAGDIYGFHGYKVSGDKKRYFATENKFVGKMTGVGKKKDAEKKPGEWNRFEVTFKDGNLTVMVNGELVNEAVNCDIEPGKIALQSEGGEIHFRTVQLTEL